MRRDRRAAKRQRASVCRRRESTGPSPSCAFQGHTARQCRINGSVCSRFGDDGAPVGSIDAAARRRTPCGRSSNDVRQPRPQVSTNAGSRALWSRTTEQQTSAVRCWSRWDTTYGRQLRTENAVPSGLHAERRFRARSRCGPRTKMPSFGTEGPGMQTPHHHRLSAAKDRDGSEWFASPRSRLSTPRACEDCLGAGPQPAAPGGGVELIPSDPEE